MNFDYKGLIPAIIQDFTTNKVLMLAYMNEESFRKTLETGKTTFWSRSKERLWTKGEESGHFQTVKEIYIDCDEDALLIKVTQEGAACHTNNYSCFYRKYENGKLTEIETSGANAAIIYEVYDVICDRIQNPKEGSYTNYLFEKGLDKMLKKVGEEAAEVIIAAKNRSKSEVTYEVADLFFHLLVTLKEQGINPDEIFEELKKRR